MSSDSEDEVKAGEEEVTDLSNSDVVAKYKQAATFAQQALAGIITRCVAGASVVEICALGDALIERQCARAFKSKKIEKGVAFPTCVSVNNCVCHYSPLTSESINLAEGDSVKIDLGCHIDGYIAVVAHTLTVGETEMPEEMSNVLVAAHTAAEAALRTIVPGNTNKQVTDVIKRVADHFGVERMQGTLSHQMKQFVIDGNKVIIQREEPEQKVEDCTFEENEVYAIDVCFSTGEGKPRDTGTRTTVFKRALENSYSLKMKASRYVITEVTRRFPPLPFTIRVLDERQARMGVVECTKHDLLHPYPVLFERDGSSVAHFKFTALVLPGGTTKITGMEAPGATSPKTDELDEDLKALLATKAVSSKNKRKKKNRKKRETAGAGDAAAEATA